MIYRKYALALLIRVLLASSACAQAKAKPGSAESGQWIDLESDLYLRQIG